MSKPTILLTFLLTEDQLKDFKPPPKESWIEAKPLGIVTHANDLTYSKWSFDSAIISHARAIWGDLKKSEHATQSEALEKALGLKKTGILR